MSIEVERVEGGSLPRKWIVALMAVAAALAAGLIFALFPFFPRQLGIDEGDITTRDLLSPQYRNFTYIFQDADLDQWLTPQEQPSKT